VEEELKYNGPARVWHHRPRTFRMVGAHRHADLEANLVIEGSAAYLVDGARLDLQPGSLLFLHRGEAHMLFDESADFRMWLAVWRPESVAAMVREGVDAATAAERPGATEFRRLAPPAMTRLARLFADVSAADGQAAASGQGYLLWRCRGEFAAAAEVAAIAANPAVVAAAQSVRVDPGQPLAAVAAQVGLSPDRLGRLFRAETGIALVDYRTRIRLDRVCAAWNPGAEFLALALDAGFGSYSAFNRAFRKRFGHAPRDFLASAAVDDRVPR
jgi:methylphosphotriester-DNA--protein-cysteine methyltransferase